MQLIFPPDPSLGSDIQSRTPDWHPTPKQIDPSILAVRADDLNAFLIKNLEPSLHRICRWRTPPNWSRSAWEEEVRAMALAAAWQSTLDFEPARGVPLAAFLFHRVVSRVFTRYRQEWAYASHHSVYVDAHLLQDLGEGAKSGGNESFLEEIEGGLSHLSESDRLLLRQVFWDGLPQRVVADRLAITQQAVSKRLSSALKQLRRSLSANQSGVEGQ